MFDDFPGPDRNLVGTTPAFGSVWLAADGGYASLIVSGHRIEAPPNVVGGAQVDGALTAPQLAADWWARFTFIPGAQPAADVTLGVWMGSENGGVYFGSLVAYGITHGVNSAEFQGGNLAAAEVDVTVAFADINAEQELVFQWTASGGHVTLILNDVQIGTVAGVTIDPSTTLNFQVEESLANAVPAISIGLVELGRGVYPG